MPGCSGEPVVTTSCAFYFCTRDCGCSAHPAFPAPSLLEGGCLQKLGRFHAARMRRCVSRSSSLRKQGTITTSVSWSKNCQPCQTARPRSRDERNALTRGSLLPCAIAH